MRKTTVIDGVEWTQVCRSIDVTQREGFRVEVDIEHDIAFFRIDGVVYGVANICTHKREAVIFQGAIEDCTVTCPLHGWVYDVKTGKKMRGGLEDERTRGREEQRIESERGLQSYKVMERDGYVWAVLEEIKLFNYSE